MELYNTSDWQSKSRRNNMLKLQFNSIIPCGLHYVLDCQSKCNLRLGLVSRNDLQCNWLVYGIITSKIILYKIRQDFTLINLKLINYDFNINYFTFFDSVLTYTTFG